MVPIAICICILRISSVACSSAVCHLVSPIPALPHPAPAPDDADPDLAVGGPSSPAPVSPSRSTGVNKTPVISQQGQPGVEIETTGVGDDTTTQQLVNKTEQQLDGELQEIQQQDSALNNPQPDNNKEEETTQRRRNNHQRTGNAAS